MITCDFYLNNRVKTITGEDITTCWNTFKEDFGEAISELCKVKPPDCGACACVVKSINEIAFNNHAA